MINEEEPQQVAFEDADETDSDSDLDEFVIQHAMLHQIENPDIPIPTNMAHGQYPEWLHYPGTKRPDGVLYEFLSRENWNIAPINPGDIIIHLIELFVTTAGYIDKKKPVKEKQYAEIINWLHSQGYTRIKLHLIPLTVEGFIPTECKETLKKLGVRPAQWNELKTKMERTLHEYAVKMIWKRRALEVTHEFRNKSGYYWVKKLFKYRYRKR